jgi:phosphoglycolate phosphatase
MTKLVVFDWNGTLLSDTRACMDADNYILKTFGGKPVDLKTYRETITVPAIDFYVRHGCDRTMLEKNVQKLGEVFHAFYEQRSSKCRTRRGAKYLLERLRRRNISSVILSNHTVSGIRAQLQRLGLEDLITEVLANTSLDTAMKRRNKREKLRQYLQSHQYQPEEVFIVGDSPEETEMGQHLGIGTVAIADGYYAEARLKAAKPDYLIHTLREIQKII